MQESVLFLYIDEIDIINIEKNRSSHPKISKFR